MSEELPEGVYPCPSCGELLLFPDGDVATQLKETQDELLRLRAEFENYRKRLDKKKEEDLKFASEKLVVALLDAVDSLQEAISNAPDYYELDGTLDGLRFVDTQIHDTLGQYGVYSTGEYGEKFDPNKHEAVDTRPPGTAPPGTVAIVYRKGYTMHDRCIRPAKVAVTI